MGRVRQVLQRWLHLHIAKHWRLWGYVIPVCIIMQWAGVERAFFIFDTLKICRETEVGPASFFSKGVDIQDGAIRIDSLVTAIKSVNIVLREGQRFFPDGIWLVGGHDSSRRCVGQVAENKTRSHWVIGQFQFPQGVYAPGGRLPEHIYFGIQRKYERVSFHNQIEPTRHGIQIWPQLTILRIAANSNLIVGISERAISQNRIGGNKEQSEHAYFVVPVTKIFLCFLVSGFLLFFGLPEMTIRGFIMTLAGLLLFMLGFGLLISHFAENVDVSSVCYDASATC